MIFAFVSLLVFPTSRGDSGPDDSGTLAQWWRGRNATGDWLGARPSLSEKGIHFRGFWKGYLYLVTSGGLTDGRARSTFDEEIKFLVTLDLEKLAGIPGVTLEGDVRWRDGENVNKYVNASPGFNPSPIQTGKTWRMGQAYATWKSGDLFPIPDMVTLSGGWQNPYSVFGNQPLSKFFTNNVIVANKGIGLAGIPWSSSYAAWGGFLRVKPTDWTYIQSGLYMAIPGATNTANYGLYFNGAAPASANGLYFLTEVGLTPRLGNAELDGKYAAGFLYYGVETASFRGGNSDARWAAYLQVDQRLFREAAGPDSKLSTQGLTWINWFTLSPQNTSNVPFYFHTGLVYEGLIPNRDADLAGVAFAFGSYSQDRIDARRARGLTTQDTYEAVVEIDYRIAITKFLYTKPFWQYVIRPNAGGVTPNANVFGMEFHVTF